MKFCLLQDREIVYTTNIQEWTDRMTTIDQTLAFDVVFRYTWVRTIFTGIEDGNGCSFETAIALDKGEDGILRWRSQSYGEALCRHAVAVERLRSLREILKKSLEEEAKTKIEIETEDGIIDQVLPNGMYRVKCVSTVVLATVGSKASGPSPLAVDDHVIVEISPYDSSRARVVGRLVRP